MDIKRILELSGLESSGKSKKSLSESTEVPYGFSGSSDYGFDENYTDEYDDGHTDVDLDSGRDDFDEYSEFQEFLSRINHGKKLEDIFARHMVKVYTNGGTIQSALNGIKKYIKDKDIHLSKDEVSRINYVLKYCAKNLKMGNHNEY